MLPAALEGKIRALYIMGENPVLSDANITHVVEALGKLEFLVVQDIFLSEAAKLAYVVLPVSSYAERDGTYSNTERRVQLTKPVVLPPRQARWDRETFTRRLGQFHPAEYQPAAEETDSSFPIVLTTGRMLERYHTGTMTRRSKGLHGLVPGPFVEVNGADAKKIRVKDGDRVKVTSRRRSIVLPATVGSRVDTGIFFIPFCFREPAVNVFTDPASDPTAGIPEFTVCAVRVERAPELGRR
jgi:predicted molibdopterin-dependent oxidoreductase YjgC